MQTLNMVADAALELNLDEWQIKRAIARGILQAETVGAGDQQMGPRFGPDDFFALQFDHFSKAASPHPVGPRELVLIEGRQYPYLS